MENTTSWLCAMELPWEILSWLVILIKIHSREETFTKLFCAI